MTSPLATMGTPSQKDAPVAQTALGDLRGVFRDDVAAFHGVPYAAPPVGNLRFRVGYLVERSARCHAPRPHRSTIAGTTGRGVRGSVYQTTG